MYPHERSLVERLKAEPFVLLGVNSDPRETALEAVKTENLTWRSWWDGGTTRGPIATRWNVKGWPTIYIIDHRGVIRFKNLYDTKAIDRAIDQLLEELKDGPDR